MQKILFISTFATLLFHLVTNLALELPCLLEDTEFIRKLNIIKEGKTKVLDDINENENIRSLYLIICDPFIYKLFDKKN